LTILLVDDGKEMDGQATNPYWSTGSNSKLTDRCSQSLISTGSEIAPLTKDAGGDVITSEESNAADKGILAENRRNKWLNSRTRGLWWVWLCLFAVSGLVAICCAYSKENGTLPTAAK
jgi:hypothetical protein